jgi:hypothetical protein
MNRWIPALAARLVFPHLGRTGLLSACIVLFSGLWACLVVGPAMAQSGRSFPPQAQPAVLQVTQAPDLLLNGKPARLAPGARIRASDDLLMLSGTLTGQTLVLNMVLEAGGLVKEVLILSPEEAAQAPTIP